MGWLDKLIGRTDAQDIALAVAVAKVDPRGAPGTRVYHEYFIADEPTAGRWPWLARVYAADSTPHEMTGSEETSAKAAQSAIAWAESAKTTLRGKSWQ